MTEPKRGLVELRGSSRRGWSCRWGEQRCSGRLQPLDQGTRPALHGEPRAGSWERKHGGPIYGRLGVMRHRSEVVECHLEEQAEVGNEEPRPSVSDGGFLLASWTGATRAAGGRRPTHDLCRRQISRSGYVWVAGGRGSCGPPSVRGRNLIGEKTRHDHRREHRRRNRAVKPEGPRHQLAQLPVGRIRVRRAFHGRTVLLTRHVGEVIDAVGQVTDTKRIGLEPAQCEASGDRFLKLMLPVAVAQGHAHRSVPGDQRTPPLTPPASPPPRTARYADPARAT
jgi:hypothetical protein